MAVVPGTGSILGSLPSQRSTSNRGLWEACRSGAVQRRLYCALEGIRRGCTMAYTFTQKISLTDHEDSIPTMSSLIEGNTGRSVAADLCFAPNQLHASQIL